MRQMHCGSMWEESQTLRHRSVFSPGRGGGFGVFVYTNQNSSLSDFAQIWATPLRNLLKSGPPSVYYVNARHNVPSRCDIYHDVDQCSSSSSYYKKFQPFYCWGSTQLKYSNTIFRELYPRYSQSGTKYSFFQVVLISMQFKHFSWIPGCV